MGNYSRLPFIIWCSKSQLFSRHFTFQKQFTLLQHMLRKFVEIFGKRSKPLLITVRKGREQTTIECKAGDNLMDITNSIVNQDVNIFGLCDKQLACTTCRVDIQSHFQKLPPPTEQELDVLLTTKNYQDNSSRMACQIFLTSQLDGMVVRIQPQSTVKKS